MNVISFQNSLSVLKWYTLAGICFVTILGATWGTHLLWKIGIASSFTESNFYHINTHGHAQIYGWIGLMIMGLSYHLLPRLWSASVEFFPSPLFTLVCLLLGLIFQTIGSVFYFYTPDISSVLFTGFFLQILSTSIFTAHIFTLFKKSQKNSLLYIVPSNAFILTSVFFLACSCYFSIWHHWKTLVAPLRSDVIWQVSTFQPPLRNLQIHGMMLCMILGMSLNLFPKLFGTPRSSTRISWVVWSLIIGAIVLETSLFLLYRFQHKHYFAALLLLPWLMLTIACSVYIFSSKILQHKPPLNLRVNYFYVQAAFIWLLFSLLQLILLPLYQMLNSGVFSHAYIGSIRHAITVGFVSVLILGIAPRILIETPSKIPPLFGPFIMINVGCFLRVLLQVATDWYPQSFSIIGISGIIELSAFIWWGWKMFPLLRKSAIPISSEK